MYATEAQLSYIRTLADKLDRHTAARGGCGAVDLYEQITGDTPQETHNLTREEASDLIDYAKSELGWS